MPPNLHEELDKLLDQYYPVEPKKAETPGARMALRKLITKAFHLGVEDGRVLGILRARKPDDVIPEMSAVFDPMTGLSETGAYIWWSYMSPGGQPPDSVTHFLPLSVGLTGEEVLALESGDGD